MYRHCRPSARYVSPQSAIPPCRENFSIRWSRGDFRWWPWARCSVSCSPGYWRAGSYFRGASGAPRPAFAPKSERFQHFQEFTAFGAEGVTTIDELADSNLEEFGEALTQHARRHVVACGLQFAESEPGAA